MSEQIMNEVFQKPPSWREVAPPEAVTEGVSAQ